MSEAVVVRAVDPGENHLGTIFPRIRRRALRLLARHRIPGQDVDDLLQQAVLALLCKYDHVRDPEAWILGTLRNKCRRYWRGRRQRPVECLDEESLETVLQPSEPTQEREVLRHDLEHLLARVPGRCRTVLRYRYVLGLRATEVAEILGWPAARVRQVTSRCLRALHRQMEAARGSVGE